MIQQNIYMGNEGRKKLLNGVKKLANAVSSTLGPGGRNVIYRMGNATYITKDGVTVARHVNPPDVLEKMGADIIRQASEQSAHQAGDGTSTSAILTEAIASEGMKLIETGYNPISIQRGVISAAKTIANYITENIKQECSPEQIHQIALVSTNWDKEIAHLVSEAVEKVGLDGSITINNSRSNESSSQFIAGLRVPRGWMSSYFVNNTTKQECILENPLILLSGIKLTNNQQIMPILQKVFNTKELRGRPLFIIAPDIESEVLQTLVINKIKGIINICAIKCPGYGDGMKREMEDLEITLGGTYFTELLSRDFNSIREEDFATCEKIVCDKRYTTFLKGGGNPQRLKEHIDLLKEERDNCSPGSWEEDVLNKRIAKLAQGVCVLNIGGNSESELNEIKDRVDDAVCACQAALRSGVIPGGGSVLAKIKENKSIKFETGDESFNAGINLMRKVLDIPLKTLLENAGVERPDVIIEKVAKAKGSIGFDIKTQKLVDMLEAGIIDPFSVCRCAIENAAASAGLILTTETFLVDEQSEK